MKISNNFTLDFYVNNQDNKELIQDINLNLIAKEIFQNIYKVQYTYNTLQGDYCKSHKYLISSNEVEGEIDFLIYINKYNNEHPHNTMLNIKILDVTCIGKLKQKI
jgi:hypothetical protein